MGFVIYCTFGIHTAVLAALLVYTMTGFGAASSIHAANMSLHTGMLC